MEPLLRLGQRRVLRLLPEVAGEGLGMAAREELVVRAVVEGAHLVEHLPLLAEVQEILLVYFPPKEMLGAQGAMLLLAEEGEAQVVQVTH
jgi:hypothetical protein